LSPKNFHMQINIHLLGTLVAFAIVLRLFLVIQRLRDQRKYGYENKVVILVLGPLLSGKSAIVRLFFLMDLFILGRSNF
jgi:hypothetical protein